MKKTKKILEVLEDEGMGLRFNTDLDVKKNLNIIPDLICEAAWSMTTSLWGGNEISVLAIIRALTIADLGVSVNRREMIRHYDEESKHLAKVMADALHQMKKDNVKITTFPPGVKPPKADC